MNTQGISHFYEPGSPQTEFEADVITEMVLLNDKKGSQDYCPLLDQIEKLTQINKTLKRRRYEPAPVDLDLRPLLAKIKGLEKANKDLKEKNDNLELMMHTKSIDYAGSPLLGLGAPLAKIAKLEHENNVLSLQKDDLQREVEAREIDTQNIIVEKNWNQGILNQYNKHFNCQYCHELMAEVRLSCNCPMCLRCYNPKSPVRGTPCMIFNEETTGYIALRAKPEKNDIISCVCILPPNTSSQGPQISVIFT